MAKAYEGRLHGFHRGMNGEQYPDLRGKPADYRIGYAYGYCEGVDTFTALEKM